MLGDAHANIDWYTDALHDALGRIEKHRILTMAVAMESYLAAGCYFTVGVDVLNPGKTSRIAEILPLDRILLETDNPGGYQWLAHETGMPDLLLKIVEKVSEAKGLTPVELECILWRNWQDFITEAIKHIKGRG